ncbi:J domain-containing protein [Streptomyces caniscabiei]|uniref:J domain-containing protein n=1 Tax=Streptomyces caniscabiei TaxID=2746961 RepID=UPI0029B0A6CA|nr:J domain-containing protein [Streptomyces caniscabiei]MDX2601799.1 J domain-containing protein [Streptomyces caniscabiei]MDX2737234.1 J domain-containing protein [Streptomyces caniscabiei]MDX2779462.1 J domain-containing protein [Streptomyces caniscabiei]
MTTPEADQTPSERSTEPVETTEPDAGTEHGEETPSAGDAEPAQGSASADGQGEGAGDVGGGGSGRPEERLERAVRAAEQALIEYEIAVETFRVEVENFSRLHHQKLGPMYARLDELDAQIAEAKAARTGDPEDVRKAQEARARVMPMPGVEELFHGWMDSEGLFPEAAAMLTDQPVRSPERVRPSDEARRLYRELVRKAHPDLARDDKERERRDEFIARVNAAYGRGDEVLLRELSEEWAAGPVPEERRPSRAEELYARLEWLAQRKELLALLARELEEGAIGSMLRIAPDDPDRLLDEIADQLLAEVAQRETELAGLVGRDGPDGQGGQDGSDGQDGQGGRESQGGEDGQGG